MKKIYLYSVKDFCPETNNNNKCSVNTTPYKSKYNNNNTTPYKIDNSDWGVVQLEERLTVTQEVVGSSPTAPACLLYSIYSLMEQGGTKWSSVEQGGRDKAYRICL